MNEPSASPHCPLCQSTDAHCIEQSDAHHAVYCCSRCDLGFVAPLPARDELAAAYDGAYYEPWRDTRQQSARQIMWQRRVELIARLAPAGGHLLDIGGGDGSFIAAASRAGYQLSATEFSEAGARIIRERVPHADVRVGELLELELPSAEYDVITLWHSLEHMRHPFEVLREVRRLLKPDGLLLIAVPNRNNRPMAALYRLLKGRAYPLFSLVSREIHLFHFSERSLRRALADAGFDVEPIGWDRSMVEPAKQWIDRIAALSHLLGGPLWTEAMLAVARPRGSR